MKPNDYPNLLVVNSSCETMLKHFGLLLFLSGSLSQSNNEIFDILGFEEGNLIVIF